MSGILFSKLMPPQLKSNIMDRPRLVKLFAGIADRKLTLFIAPAGYGKTVSMAQLAETIGKPLVWYQLDDYDNDPAVFLQYLIAGLGQHFPDFGHEVPQIMNQGGMALRLRLLVTAIVNDLEEKAKNGLIIVLDDYHLVTEPLIHNFILELLKYLPPGIHILIAGRTQPPLQLSRLDLQEEVFIAGSEELRFTRQEIGVFLNRNGKDASDEALTALEHKTTGWPAALRLVGDSATGVSDLLEKHSTQKIYDYLASEILDQQPENIRNFLLDTSVLEELEPAFCNHLLERTNSGEILDFLEKQQLFLIPLGDRKTYRYHQLFREFLLERLGTKRTLLLHRAGLLSRQGGQLESAVEYLAQASQSVDLYSVIKEASIQAFSQGHWQTVDRWLNLLPAGILSDDPWLILHKAKIEMYRGRLSEAEKCIDRAVTLFINVEDQKGLVECRLLQAPILQRRGRYKESLELLEWAISLMTEEERVSRFDLILEKAYCLFFSGRYRETEAVLAAALKVAEQNGINIVVPYLLEGMGNIYWVLGRYPQALQTYQKAAELSPDRILSSYYTQDLITRIYQDWGEWEQAFDYIKRSIAIKENYGLTEALPSAYHLLGELYYDRREWGLAEEYINRALNLIRENDGESFAQTMMLLSFAECLGLQGRWIEARSKVEEAFAGAPRQSIHAIGVCRVYGFLPYFQTGNIREAIELLAAGMADFEKLGFKKGLGIAYSLQAWRYFQEEDLEKAGEYTEKVLTVTAQINDQNTFLRWYDLLQPVLKIGMESGFEVTFIQRVLIRLGERALPLLTDLSDHINPVVRRRLVAPLAEIGGTPAQKIIHRLTEDADVEVRQLARLTAQRLGIIPFVETHPELPVIPLQITTLGPFRVFIRGREINWRTTKTRDLLGYLVHQGEPVSKDKFLEELWPEIDPDSATDIFRITLYFLRKTLKKADCQNLIHYSNKRYQLLPSAFDNDRQRFLEQVTEGLRTDTAPGKAITLLEQAVSLYRGDYMENMDYPWILPAKQKLKYLCIEARMRLARYYLKVFDYNRTISHLQIVEEYDPLIEEAHTMLMTAYAGSGNRMAIKRQYEKMKAILKKELSLSPSPAVNNLYLKLVK